jgi:iron complex outermembrane recepter protein
MKQTILLSALVGAIFMQPLTAETYLPPVTASESEYSGRDDLALESPTNLYRLEQSALFGTEVLDAEEIEAYKPKDFFDLLNKAAGLDVTYQGRKHPYFINMRGGGNITYILDGAILPASSDRILQKIPMAAIEEIQIVRSATALSLAPSIGIGASNSGSGTNVGFIVIRTKRPAKSGGSLSMYYEKADEHPAADGQSLYVGTRIGDAEVLGGYLGGMVSRYNRPGKSSWFDGSDADAVMATAGVHYGRFNANVMGYFDSGSFEMQRGVTTTGEVHNSKWYYDPIKTKVLSFDSSMIWNERQVTLFSASHIVYQQREFNEYFDSDASAEKHYSEETQTYSLRHNARFGDTALYLGGQMTYSEGFGPNLSKRYNDFETSVTGFSLSVEQTLLNKALVLDAGYRQDIKHIDHSTAARSEALATPDANNDVDMAPANVFAMGAVYRPDDIYTLNARYYYGDEGTSGDFDLETEDNATLHAERQHRWEVGVEAVFSRAFVPILTYFDVEIENEKTATGTTYTDADGSEYYYYTEADAHRKGVELSIKGHIAAATRYKFSWTSMIANETYENGERTDSIGTSTPKNLFSALLTHAWDVNRLNVSLKRADAYSSSSSAMGVSTDVKLGDYTRIDANIARDFTFNGQDATIKLYGRNLTNDQYATRYTTGYYYDRGRTLGVEFSMMF